MATQEPWNFFESYITMHVEGALIFVEPDFAILATIQYQHLLVSATEPRTFKYRELGEIAFDSFLVQYFINLNISFLFFSTVKTYVQSPQTFKEVLVIRWPSISEDDAVDLFYLFLGIMDCVATSQVEPWLLHVFSSVIDAAIYGYQKYVEDIGGELQNRRKKYKARSTQLSKVEALLRQPQAPPVTFAQIKASNVDVDPLAQGRVARGSPDIAVP
ncbi:hypothetical protein R3P38DRAFT_312422 [Favolaschia claudopus]|uniref:Uncharacterized protein n=1 Tax=Favolaschia claudopus TaxID=2862362 RepID=A0AAW0CQM3_9AGAR